MGAKHSEASCKRSNSEELDGVTETLLRGISPGCAFDDSCEPQDSSESGRTLREAWTKSFTQASDSRKTSVPHKDALADQTGCESSTLGDNPNVWPDFTSQEKTSSENSGALTNFGPDPPCTPSGRASATCGDCGNTVQRKSRLQKTPYTCSQCREKPSASARTWHSIRLCTPGQSPMHVRTVAKPSAGSPT